MTQIGINVPPGFVITTEACLDYLDAGSLPASLMAEVRAEITELEKATGKRFGDPSKLLLNRVVLRWQFDF